MLSSCLLLTFQDNFHLYQGYIAFLPASIWKYHFNDLYSHCGKGRFFVKPSSWFSILWLSSHEGEKGTSSVSTTSDRHTMFIHLRWHMCCWSEGSTHLPFLLLEGPLWPLRTHLCNWFGISKKHRPTHAHEALMQGTPWTVRWGNTAGSRQSYQNYLIRGIAHFSSYRLSTSICEGQAQTLKTPFPFDAHLFFRVSFSPNTHWFTASPFPSSSSFTAQGTDHQIGPKLSLTIKLTVKPHTHEGRL